MRRITKLLFLLLALGWLFTPQYYGFVQDARDPAVEVAAVGYDAKLDKAGHSADFRTSCSVDRFSHAMAEEGFTRNPLAKEHQVNGDEMESWAYRDHVYSTYQTHVTLDERRNGTAIYVHREYNYLRHPVKHLQNPPLSFDVTAEERFKQLMQDNRNSLLWQVRDTLAKSETCVVESTDAEGT